MFESGSRNRKSLEGQIAKKKLITKNGFSNQRVHPYRVRLQRPVGVQAAQGDANRWLHIEIMPELNIVNNPKFILRRANGNDIPYIYALRERTMKEQFSSTYGWDETFQRNMAEDHIEDAKIILDEEKRIGVVKVLRERNRFVLHQIQLEPEYQGKGIGSQIISSFIREAEDEKLPIDLWVIKIAKAKMLYEKLGFEVVEDHNNNCLMRLNYGKQEPTSTSTLR